MLWIDKYRPSSLSSMEVHSHINARLQQLCKSSDLPHLLLYGPSGAGKKTRVNALLRELFGASAQKVKVEHKEITVGASGYKKIEVETLASNHHIEINAAESGLYDRYVVSEMIKEIASSAPISINPFDQPSSSSSSASTHASSSSSSNGVTGHAQFKCIVLHDVDRMSREAQQALRRLMEKYMKSCRMILVCESLSRVIEPLHSRCLCVRVPLPTEAELVNLLASICAREKLQLPAAGSSASAEEFLARFARANKRNMLATILSLETAKMQQYPFAASTSMQDVPLPDWETYVVETAKMIIEKQAPVTVLAVRDRFLELLTNCIPADAILTTLVRALLRKCDNVMKQRVLAAAAKFDQRMRRGAKAIFHLEAFVVAFMTEYRNYLQNATAQAMDIDDLGELGDF
eukprot:ANDGO_06888.mRNA.1 hypothetical protein